MAVEIASEVGVEKTVTATRLSWLLPLLSVNAT